MLPRAAQVLRAFRGVATRYGSNGSNTCRSLSEQLQLAFADGLSAQPRSARLSSSASSSGSSGTGSGIPSTSGFSTAESNSRLFEKIPPIPEVEQAAAAAASRAGAEARQSAKPATAASRATNAISNGIFYTFLGSAAFAGYYQYAYEADDLERVVDDVEKESSSFPGSSLWVQVMRWYLEQRRYVEDRVKEFAEPPSDKLLPDMPPQLRHVRTLVLDLNDVLIHADWKRERGWRSFKRPGVEEFLATAGRYYELVLYTDQQSTYVDPILDRIDPHKHIMYRLYRNSTYYVDGKHVRDLSRLNRDLSKVLFVSSDPDAYSLQPENTVKLPPWKLDPQDTTLPDLLPFLEAIYRTDVPDVRDVVRSYEGEHIPTAFKERMNRITQAQRSKQTASGGFLSGITRRS